MNDPLDAAEANLCAAYREEIDRYERAVQLVEGLPAALQDGTGGGEVLPQVLARLDEVAAIEAQITESKRRWREGERKPGPQLQHAIARLRELVERLSALIRAAEQQALAEKERLAPALDAAVRSRQMLRAYGGGSQGHVLP
jgi:hypothetical protein